MVIEVALFLWSARGMAWHFVAVRRETRESCNRGGIFAWLAAMHVQLSA